MSYKDNADFRSRSAGGYAYSENYLWDVFQPLIESDGTGVYQALTRLIPRAAIDADRQVTLRSLEEASGVSKTQVARKLQEILALGMVTERRYGSRRAATYQLHSLVELAELGREELLRRLVSVIGIEEMRKRIEKRGRFDERRAALDLEILERIGVPPRDTNKADHLVDQELDSSILASETLAGRDDREHMPAKDLVAARTSPAASGENGVPRWDTETKSLQVEVSEISVSQKQGSVSHTEASVSHTEASVSQKSRAFNTREVEVEVEKDLTPQPPVPGGSRALILPYENCRYNDPGFTLAVGVAARWVMRELGMTGRIEHTITKALTGRAEATGDTLQDVAQLAVAQYNKLLREEQRGILRFQWGPKEFFANGHWLTPGGWPRKEEALRREANASVGIYRPAAKEAAGPVMRLDQWDIVKSKMAVRLGRSKQRERDLGAYRQWVEPAELFDVEMDGAAMVWMLSSPHPRKTEIVIANLWRDFHYVVREVAGIEVQLKVVIAEDEPA